MQRDTYASLVKKAGQKMLNVKVLQLSGQVTVEPMHEDTFQGILGRRLVFMTHMAGISDPAAPKLPRDTIITSFEQLATIHQPHFQYKLLPLLCHNTETFAVLQSIVSSPGSPFRIEDRKDVSLFRLNGRGVARTGLIGFQDFLWPPESRPPKWKPFTQVGLDGLLVNTPGNPSWKPDSQASWHIPSINGVAEGHVGYVLRKPAIHTIYPIDELVLMKAALSDVDFCSKYCVFPFMDSLRLVRNKYCFLASDSAIAARVRKQIFEYARKYNVFIYERFGDNEYRFSVE